MAKSDSETNKISFIEITSNNLSHNSSTNSIIKTSIGKPKFYSSSLVIVIARGVSMFSLINFLRRCFCFLEKYIPSKGASFIFQTLTVGKTSRDFHKFKYAPRKVWRY